MKKWKISDEQKRKAVDMATKLGTEAKDVDIEDAERKVDKFKGNKILSPVWDNIMLLKALLKNPHVQGSLLCLSLGAILYLVLPVDVIPDFIPVIGLLDDVAVVLSLFPLVMNGIKKDPEKALKVFDSLPQSVKKTAARALGLAGGAYAGFKVGSVVGDKVKDIELGKEYHKLVGGPLPLEEGYHKLKDDLFKKGEELVVAKVEAMIGHVFAGKYRRSLEIVALFLLSMLFSLSPFTAGVYIASILLLLAYGFVLFSFIRGCVRIYPYVKDMVKERSVSKGVEKQVKEQYIVVAQSERIINAFGLELRDEDVKQIVKYFFRLLKKQIIALIVGGTAITVGFWCFKATLANLYLNKSVLEIMLYPFTQIFTK